MIETRVLIGADLEAALPDVARLRIAVFRDWPYLYDGDVAYEESYLQTYRASPKAILVGAYHDDTLIGAATGTPLADHAAEFRAVADKLPVPVSRIFYCAESVLLPAYRGQGIGHAFFDTRETHARAHGFTHVLFCGVVRPTDHPLKPAGYRPLDPFWRKRGYAPIEGAVAQFRWTDVDQARETEKPLQVWFRAL